MMVQWRHFEKSFPVCQLEIRYLENDGYCLYEINYADNDEYQRVSCHDRQRNDRSAEKKRACVTHEHSCGMSIVYEKAETSSENRNGERRRGIFAGNDSFYGKERAHRRRDGGGEPVDTVCEVYGIRCEYKERDEKNIKPEAELSATLHRTRLQSWR